MPVQPDSERDIIVGVDDMFFAAKINAAAEAVGAKIKRARSADELFTLANQSGARLIIIDLNSTRLDPIPTIRLLKSTAILQAIPIIGFVSHVQVDLMDAAGQAGCDYVMPRSAFSSKLAALLSGRLED